MKNKLGILLFIIMLTGVHTHLVSAQVETESFIWDSYNMGFSIPKSFTVIRNDSSVFSAGDSAINLTIYPIDASGIDSSNMVSLLGQWVTQNNVELLSDYEFFNDEGNYFGVLCAGMMNSNYTMLILALDPDYVDIGFYIWFSYQEESLDTVVNIIDSFYPI